jgi:hypothetical protein
MLVEQGIVVFYQHVPRLELEAFGVRAQANASAPPAKAKGRVPMHHGLRDRMRSVRRARLGQGEEPARRPPAAFLGGLERGARTTLPPIVRQSGSRRSAGS